MFNIKKDYKIGRNKDYKVKNIKLAEKGKRLVEMAEKEMPGLMSLRKEFEDSKPLRGANIIGCLHMTVETAVLIETLIVLGANVRWSSCNPLSTNDMAAAYIASKSIPVFAWEGETEAEYDWCISQTIEAKGWEPNLVLDDGGALVKRIHEYYPDLISNLFGVSEQTTTGAIILNNMEKNKSLKLAAININDSVTKSKFDNFYGCRESLLDGLKRASDIMIAGKTIVVCGYGQVGKGVAMSLRLQGARVIVTEIDPICALQAAMEGFEVKLLENTLDEADVFITATGNCDIINIEHMKLMKDGAILGNIGHSDVEIMVNQLNHLDWDDIKEGVDKVHIEENKHIILLAKGRLVNLVCGTGHPPFVMSISFSNQVLAQIELWTNSEEYKVGNVYLLSKELDEKVARLHLDKLGVELTQVNEKQKEYLQISEEGPFKGDYYQY